MPETPLLSYLRIQTATDRQILDALRVASVSVDGELRRLQAKTGVGNAMRKEQLLRSQATINRQLGTYFDKVGKTVEAATAKAAAAGADTILRESKGILSEVLSKADYELLSRSAQQSAVQSLSTMERRVEGSSYIPLSEQVYNTQSLTQDKVGDIVNSALARGASAAELARDVRKYINPNTPGGVRYASMRLGRTELNNAFHAAQIKEAQDSPWVDALQWHLSGSHPRPDACNAYADDVHYKDGEAGFFKPDEVPAKPHPQCLCFTTPVTPSREDFINAFMKGDYDKHLDDMGLQAPVIEDAKAVLSPVHKVGSPELKTQMRAAERQRETLERSKFNLKNGPGGKKGNYNSELGYTSDSSRALSGYTEMNNVDMNLLKRDPAAFRAKSYVDDAWVDHIATQNELVEGLLKKNFLTEDITVARGMTGDFSTLKSGEFFADPGFLSTTTDLKAFLEAPSGAFKAGKDVGDEVWSFVIQAKKGTQALPGADYQKEILFGPGTRQRILSVDKETRTIYSEIVG